MTEGYEALRAQATGAGTAHMPITARGLALFWRSGLAAWMTAWRRLVAAPSSPPAGRPRERLATAFRLGPELAVVLTEMALSQQRRWVT
jgi:hypothetical protein